MTDRTASLLARSRSLLVVAAAVLLMVGTAHRAWPQAASQPSSPVPPRAESEALSEPAPRRENPGLINEIGKLLPTLKSPKETIDDAADALSRLAKSPGVKGRVICPPAANGAPDCKAAADRLCRNNGFKEGNSLDVDTTRNCSARSLLSGRKPDESECRTETWVTRAVCQ